MIEYSTTRAEVQMPSNDLPADIAFFENIGFRLDQIFPSEDPAVARMSGYGLLIRIDRGFKGPAPVLNLLSDAQEERELQAPNGCTIRWKPAAYELVRPKTIHKFELRQLKDNAPWVIGRAGMHYRDLIPDRLGGSIIASHIRIPEAGPVPDVVHYHTIGFQLIYCYRGWVKLVYEDQGPPFILKAGDCVTQPPKIRHRVLEASANLEVIEIGVPADHMTTVDHDMKLPTEEFLPKREFEGQTFCHHQLSKASWQKDAASGFTLRDTRVSVATKGLADVRVLKPEKAFSPEVQTHNADIYFCFVLEGAGRLETEGEQYELKAGDAFVMPPQQAFHWHHAGQDLKLLQISLR